MTSYRRDPVLNDLRDLFDAGVVANLTDAQLLDRFEARTGLASERAFVTLVERHGPMVLRVCRNVLNDPHDVEDAFQATFLILLRKAGTIRNQASCGSWLHGVAFRTASALRSSTFRRREHERKASVSEATGGILEAATPSDELRGILDGALARLRDQYRSPLVLCYLEGQTCEEAARQLGWPVGTVKSRLARGRERLRRYLVRQGLAPALGAAAGTGATLPTFADAALPSSLMTRVVEAARGFAMRGSVSKTVASLVKAEFGRGLTAQAARVAAMMATVSLVVSAAALGGLGVGDVLQSKAGASTPSPDTESGPIHARVVDREGKPVAKAEVHVLKPGEMVSTSVTTDAQGQVVIPREQVGEYGQLWTRHADALGWTSRDAGQSGTVADPLVLTLQPLNHTVTGLVLDTQGRPIPKVRCAVSSLGFSGKIGLWMMPKRLEAQGWPLGFGISDEEGQFTVTLPEEANVGLIALHPRYVGPRIGVTGDAQSIDPVTLEPAGGIVGTVTDAVTGAPVSGADLAAQLLDYHERMFEGTYGECLSDAQGRFAITGLQPGVFNLHVWKVAGRDQAVASAVEGIRVRANEDVPANLKIIEGIPLRGVVVDTTLKQPVAGVPVGCYGPAHPRTGAAVATKVSDQQGRFTFFVPPGEQFVYVMDGHGMSRLSRSLITVPKSGEVGLVRLVRESPKQAQSYYMKKVYVKSDSVAKKEKEVVKKSVALSPVTKTKKEGFAKSVVAHPQAPADVPEGRTVIGQVLDTEGRPIVGATVTINSLGQPDQHSDLAATGREGIFILRGLPKHEVSVVVSRCDIEGPGSYREKKVSADQASVEFEFDLILKPRDWDEPKGAVDEPVPAELRDRLTFVNLDPKGNEFVVDAPTYGEDLHRLPRGVHKMGATFYRVGSKLIHLQGQHTPGRPESVVGIAVAARADKISILHAVQYGDPINTEVGAYVVRYTDGTSERIPIVYGRNIANWELLLPLGSPEALAEAEIAWTGTNDVTNHEPRIQIRLFAMTWSNPHPDRVIDSIDMISKRTGSDPFVVAVTLERNGKP